MNLDINEDYERKYPPATELGTELDPNARVWHVYRDEAAKYDQSMLASWREMLDIHLVYAGLFSAVVTTFLVQASQSLGSNYSQTDNYLLAELVNYHRMAAGMPTIPIHILDSLEQYDPSPTDVWVNGLWFTSLALSLFSALACVSLKQWISLYAMPIPHGVFHSAVIRQYRFRSLQRWKIPAFIGLLPQLLNASLFLFLAGLVVLLFSLHRGIALFIIVLVGSAFLAFLVSTLLPIFVVQCPYRTHLTVVLYNWLSFFWEAVPFFERDDSAVDGNNMADALFWLYDATTNPSVNSIVFEAMSAAETHKSHDALQDILGRPLSDGDPMGNDLMFVFYLQIAPASENVDSLRVERLKKTCRYIIDASREQGWALTYDVRVIEGLLSVLAYRCNEKNQSSGDTRGAQYPNTFDSQAQHTPVGGMSSLLGTQNEQIGLTPGTNIDMTDSHHELLKAGEQCHNNHSSRDILYSR